MTTEKMTANDTKPPPNVDPLEVKKFEALAHSWWDLEGPCKPLHELNPLRLAFIQSCCSLANQTILDVGCGGGILTETLSQFSKTVFGIDQAAQSLEVARLHAQSLIHPPRYEQITVEDFAKLHPEKFDVITCMELLEHVPNPAQTIEACAQLLKPGGHLIFSTLNRTPNAFLQAILGAEYLLNLLPKGTHDYAKFIRPSELSTWAREAGLLVKKIKGISYRLFSKNYYLSDNVSVNYMLYFVKDA